MLYIIILTGKCNLNCSYCGGSIDERIMPAEISYPLEELYEFLNRDSDLSIAFYGGEPLLRIDLIKDIMENVEAKHFILQTNGLLLDRLIDELDDINEFSTILVSIDGVKEVNDYYRGKTYERVMRNVEIIKKHYKGELIARMVATERTDIYRDVLHLLERFEYVHWQINAVWVDEDFYSDFIQWIREYNRGIGKLVDFWIKELERGVVRKIVPFLGIASALLGYSLPKPPCGSGENSFVISTDGKILACPICADLEWNLAGDIWNGINRNSFLDVDRCSGCSAFSVCGGRCLFFNRERLWSENKMNAVCDATKNLISRIEWHIPRIKSLIEEKIVYERDLIYPKYNNTTEIIP
ncbi:putative peptide-modifying radical SAM enzyme, AF0577 family [Archaeoglobus sulfaticallidus PM70-1]|uniref:Putative peptide-modifying radical SAM enzyme, AF0577 family n=1 Tax=Archaeoglobus sulfaticallidus PM70-1 TaxID=387631 RepID=N0BMY5_9EURY|nr:TIGR04084 family radical SAM/SPASM domain-containing protein [Archaeoglobus sulfaticallidus]AGK61640.1 putative peptide-modifying radical SAM enzyme, AF0577 family [Archaeoglobus sulfaticallidus PM70-1]